MTIFLFNCNWIKLIVTCYININWLLCLNFWLLFFSRSVFLFSILFLQKQRNKSTQWEKNLGILFTWLKILESRHQANTRSIVFFLFFYYKKKKGQYEYNVNDKPACFRLCRMVCNSDNSERKQKKVENKEKQIKRGEEKKP